MSRWKLKRLRRPESYVHEAHRAITKEEPGFNAYRALCEDGAEARHERKFEIRAARVRSIFPFCLAIYC